MRGPQHRAVAVLGARRDSAVSFGVDGCPFGWVAAITEGRAITFELFERFADLLVAARSRAALVVVDIPIGLSSDGSRACDVEARRMLGPRRSSVFPAPCRATISATSFEDACRREMSARGRRVTRQTYAILAKIREVDECLDTTGQEFVREAHPEVTFAMLRGEGTGLPFKKKSPAGRALRTELLERCLETSLEVRAERARLGRERVGMDDLLDALACLATARRIRNGTAAVLPVGAVERDARSLRIEITA